MDRSEILDRLNDPPPPAAITDREEEQATVHAAITTIPRAHLYLTGPRGAGKTLLARTSLNEISDTANTCYLCCRTANTQYKVLQELAARFTGEDISDGYHTAQLQNLVSNRLADHDTILVLDDLDILLVEDGGDLLYFLSRLDPGTSFALIGISSSEASLATNVDERTYSSLQPWHLHIDPYTERQAVTILADRFKEVFPENQVTRSAVQHVAATTTNIMLGLQWLAEAAALQEPVTIDEVQTVQPDIAHRYRLTQLHEFTPHHHILLTAIEHLTTERLSVTSGAVYERYTALCRNRDDAPLTTRRISDYLTHLELLGLIDVTHHRGGTTGKTREIRLVPLQEL